jgi:dienelactone hydrolase
MRRCTARNVGAGLLLIGGLTLTQHRAVAATPAATAPDSIGTGRYPAIKEEVATLPDHVVYRPRDLGAMGSNKLGLYVFGNGGCSADGASSRQHLLEIASHGYLAIAPGKILSGPGAPPAPPRTAPPAPGGKLTAATPARALSEAIDWALRENARPQSPLYHRIDASQIAVSGWSCGGLQAYAVATDPRIRTVVIMNSGLFPDGTNPIAGIDVDKSQLGRLHGSILYVLGGKTDIAYPNGTDDFARMSTLPAAMVNIPVGHGGTYDQPNGGLAAKVVVAWLDWKLRDDSVAARQFVGEDCGLCRSSELTIERKQF